MKTTDKVLTAFLLLFGAVVCCLLLAAELSLLNIVPLSELYAPAGIDTKFIAMLYSVVAFLLLVLFVRAIVLLFSRSGNTLDKHEKIPMAYSDFGGMFITVNALNAIAKRTCLSHKGVASCKTSITLADKGIMVALMIEPLPDCDLIADSLLLQTSVKKAVEAQTGVTVLEVPVLMLTQSQRKGR